MATDTLTLSSTEKGRHAELLAQTALLANGFTVLEPIAPEPFDLAVKRHGDKRTYYVQVKTANLRDKDSDIERYNGEWLVVKGAKNNGKVYTKEEVDFFVAVWDGNCYLFPNREVSEYWVRPSQIDEKWERLECGI